MKELTIALALIIPSISQARDNFDTVKEPKDIPLDLYRVSYDSSEEYSPEVRAAFVSITGEESVGDAIEWLAESGREIHKAECSPELCEVEWSHKTEGNGGGEINGTVIGGKVEGGGKTESSYRIKVPCVMVFETIMRLEQTKKKKDEQ